MDSAGKKNLSIPGLKKRAPSLIAVRMNKNTEELFLNWASLD